MGWSTDALVKISFSRETFDTKGKVEDYIENQEHTIEMCTNTLKQLAWMTEPKKFCEEEESPEFYIKNNLEWALEELEKAIENRYKAMRVLEAWDYMHHESGCALYEKSMKDKQRIWGDFIPTCNVDGSNPFPDDREATRLYNKKMGIKDETTDSIW